MEGFVIKYNDIYDLLWEYKEKLEGLIAKLEACENSIRFFMESESFQGESANAIKSYLNDIHITMLSSFKVTAQNFLDNIVLYKAGYYEIDSSTNFVLPEETIEEFRKKLSNGCTDTKECAGEVYGAVSGISDVFTVSQPDTNGVFRIHEQLEQELLQFISDIETQESNTVKALENSTDLLIESLQACIGKIGTNWTDINHYESNSFYTDTDVYTLAGLSQIFYQQHQDYQEVYDQIWGQEQALKDAAEERETQGIWKTVGGGVLIVTGVLCIAATGGAATPIVVAGWGIGGGTVAFGVADSIEGAQDIYYGSMGDIDSTSINQLKDVIFQGNEEAYYFAENIFAFAASAFIPISQASVAGNLTFRSGATIVGKEAISVAAGEGASQITMNVTGNQTASMLVGMMASGVTAHGLNGMDGKFNISGNKSDSTSVQHAVGSANQAQSVLDGINPKYFNPESRFGGGFYVGADADTIVAELAEHGNTAKYAISYDMNLSGQKVLDLTDPKIASEWGYVQNLTSTKACQNIGELARTKGYNVIKFQSYRGDGINFVIYNNFENILSPRNVTPVD